MTTHAALTDDYVAEAPMRPMHEQADYVAYRDCYYKDRSQTSGVAYARKVRRRKCSPSSYRRGVLYGDFKALCKDSPIKCDARSRVIKAFVQRPGNLRLLSMPGFQWFFERGIFRWRDKLNLPTEIYTVERDAPIFQASVLKMPGKTRGIRQITPHAISTDRIACHYFTTVEAFITDEKCPMFDAAWLDFTGIMSFERLAAVKQFWGARCSWRLAVTSLNGRFRPRKLAHAIDAAGGLAPYLMDALGGNVVDLHTYNDGPSTMVQLILEK